MSTEPIVLDQVQSRPLRPCVFILSSPCLWASVSRPEARQQWLSMLSLPYLSAYAHRPGPLRSNPIHCSSGCWCEARPIFWPMPTDPIEANLKQAVRVHIYCTSPDISDFVHQPHLIGFNQSTAQQQQWSLIYPLCRSACSTSQTAWYNI